MTITRINQISGPVTLINQTQQITLNVPRQAFPGQTEGNGINRFTQLQDTPSAYTGAGGYVVRVTGPANALEFSDNVPWSYITGAPNFMAVGAPYTDLAGLSGVPADRFLRTAADGLMEALTPAELATTLNRAGLRVEAVGGSANARTLTTGQGLTTLPTGLGLRARFPAANTGALTINVDGLGAVTALTATGVAMPAGYIRTTVDTDMIYDGTNWIVSRAIARGSNANGEFVRYEDGTQQCWHMIASGSVTTSVGALFQRSENESWTYPASFAAIPVVTGSLWRGGNVGGVSLMNPSTSTCPFMPWLATSTSGTFNVYLSAIGRWF